MTASQIRRELFSLSDEKYRDFQSALMPTVDKNRVIGVRTPALRSFAKRLGAEGNVKEFLSDLPHSYYEEDNLHALLIMQSRDFGECMGMLRDFLPFVDNWATCDMLRPKVLRKNLTELLEFVDELLESGETYKIRFGIGLLLSFFLDENFSPEQLLRVSGIKSEEYYVNMMIAWYFATALAKQYSSAVTYLEKNQLPLWIHNKTIQKAVESLRISDEQKKYLRGLRRK